MFEFFFKYSQAVFSKGDIGFRIVPPLIAVLLVIASVALVLWLGYKKTTLHLDVKLKSLLIGLKFVVLALLLLAILEPFVNVSQILPRKSSLIILVDDSKSMSIQDAGSDSRIGFVKNLLGDQTSGLIEQLNENFKVRMYKFSADTDHLKEVGELKAAGNASNLVEGLNFAADIGSGSDVSGIVLITDGADTGNEDPLETASYLHNQNLPLFVVGVGSETAQDVELSKVAANHSAIENSVVELSALIKNTGSKNSEVELELWEEGSIIKKQKVNLEGTATRTSMTFSPSKNGFVRYSLVVTGQVEETIKENNRKSFLIDNRKKRARVLFVEGHPRWDFRFIRRAINGDPSLAMVSLLRTGPEKYYIQGIENKNKLKERYPKTKKELFEYDAIVFGSVEANFFTENELENTRAFVAERGGGFLMLGGPHSFAQGGYSGSIIEKLLPVELPYQNGSSGTFLDRYKLVLTPEGFRSSILQLSSSPEENREKWESLPELEGFNSLGKAKPGATVLGIHPLSQRDNPKIILALQRFGRGRTMAFATSSSWHWQMRMHHEDMSHEKFWRQVLRWLAFSSPDPIGCHTDKETYIPGEQVSLKVDARDSSFTVIHDAVIKARIITPSGKSIEVPFHWSSNGKVAYIGKYHPEEEGTHVVEISVYSSKGVYLGKAETAFLVEESKAEFTNAQLQTSLLKRIAEVSGGKYYYQEEAQRLPDELSVMESSYSRLVEHDLWDMPLLFLLAILLLSVEWYLRRSKGLS